MSCGIGPVDSIFWRFRMSLMELRQNLKLSQQLVMTPRLQLAIKMLGLNNIELSDMIKQEMLENPVIDAELADTATLRASRNSETIESSGLPENIPQENEAVPVSEKAESEPRETDGFEEIAEYLVNYNEQLIDLSKTSEYSNHTDTNYLENRIENSFCSGRTLFEYVMEQVRTGDFSEEEVMLSQYVVGNLDSKGMLAVSVEDLKAFASSNITGGSDSSGLVGSVLYKIGRLEPAGLAAADVISSLAVQASCYYPGDKLLGVIIKDYIKDVASLNYSRIAKETASEIESVMKSVERLKKLNPNPASNFCVEEPGYIVPDLFLRKEEGRYVVYMDEAVIPQVKISSYYRKVLSGEILVEQGIKEYAEERFKSAMWLIKSIDTRKDTILNIAQKIIDIQVDFFEKGDGILKPLILKDIAAELGIHESTVSRATANKYISTHLGVFELKNFFTAASYGESSSDSVMKKIKAIIDSESSAGKVFSDSEIAEILKKDAIPIARRTVAKYREIMNIPSSSIRSRNAKGVKTT